MAEQKKPSKVLKAQFLLLGVLMVIFVIWAGKRCTRASEEERERAAVERIDEQRDENGYPVTAPATQTRQDTVAPPPPKPTVEKVVPLYVCIENLAMRSGPGLNYEILDRLPLYTEVRFLNEVTDSTYTLKLGKITTTEPWVKIRSHKGRDGWVYGAGVDYFKKKIEVD